MKRPAFTAAQRLRCFASHGAIVCCQAKGCDNAIYIKDAEIDHYLALIDGGKHEDDNFRPICSSCHRIKSAREHKANAKAKRIASAREVHKAVVSRVMTRPAGKIKSRGFSKTLSRKFNGRVVRVPGYE